MELNPNHPVTQQVSTQWHKIVALIMHKQKLENVVITEKDVIAVSNMAVSIQEYSDGIHISLISMEDAEKLTKKEGGLPS